jgi:hypothetical protein
MISLWSSNFSRTSVPAMAMSHFFLLSTSMMSANILDISHDTMPEMRMLITLSAEPLWTSILISNLRAGEC